MSRIGKMPIAVPAGVTVEIAENNKVTVKGPKGELSRTLAPEMEIKQAAYTSFQKQYLATQARLQENTPAFTVLQSSTIPLKPAGPKRMIFVLAMLFFATIITACVVCKNQLLAIFWTRHDNLD